MQQCGNHPVTPQEKTYNHLVVYFTRTTSVEETPQKQHKYFIYQHNRDSAVTTL
jgi:hypothetical protein